ncbi:hypothetical protein [Sinomicrobium sp. M5D2P17]
MEPVNHVLTDSEIEKVEKSFSVLPPSYYKLLKAHLHSISFMDNMPNTALTSPVETADATKKFNITFRAEILHESISEWATWKENTCYIRSGDNEYQVSIDAGGLDAIVYVLLHEATHVMDAVMEITPHTGDKETVGGSTPFTQGIWQKMNGPAEEYIDPLLETTQFRSGKAIPVSQASEVYKALRETPFVSLYSMASWFEDLAELMTVYHLTAKLNQPFQVLVKKKGKEVFRFGPMENELVKQRLPDLERFYE